LSQLWAGKSIAKIGILLAAMAFALAWYPPRTVARQQPPLASPSPSAPQNLAPQASAAQNADQLPITSYALPPELYKKAHGLGRIEFWSQLIAFPYGLILFWLVIGAKLPAKYRDVAERISSRRFLQAAAFSPLLILTVAALSSPIFSITSWRGPTGFRCRDGARGHGTGRRASA
jgi:hypothetical protein